MIAFYRSNVKRVGPNSQRGLTKHAWLFVLALGTVGCQPAPSPEDTLAQLPDFEPTAVAAMVSGSNRLNGELLGFASDQLSPDVNAVVSPYLVTETLSLLHGSAEVETIDALAEVLGIGRSLPDEVAAVHLYRRIAYQALEGNPYQARASLWSVRPVYFDKAYYPVLELRYSVDIERAGGATLNGLRAVNRWVSEHTGGAFPQAFQQLEREWILLALGALRWEVDWQQDFDPALIQPGDFLTPNGPVQADMMRHQAMQVRHVAGKDLEGLRLDAVELPLQDGRLSLLAVRQSEESVTAPLVPLPKLATLRASMQSRTLDLSLPRFSIASEIDLLPFLQAMPTFREGLAMHLGKLSPELTMGNHLTKMRQYVSLVVEEGPGRATRSGPAPTPESEFSLDQPFTVHLIDTQDGLVLLSAVVRDPTRM